MTPVTLEGDKKQLADKSGFAWRGAHIRATY